MIIDYYLRNILIKIIKFYQKTISPDHGFFKSFYPFGYCRFNPSCSQFAIDTIIKYGIIKAGPKIIWRILRCNPWNKGGNDPA